MLKIKSKLLLLALATIMMTFIVSETFAYYTVVGRSQNVITSGELKMKIIELTDQGTEFPAEGVYVMPGAVVGKRVSVENICGQPFYLRVKVISATDDTALSAEDCFKLDINYEDWNLVDGWYYYYTALEPGQTTSQVFSKVEIVGSKVDNRYLGKTLSLTVEAQAVQAKNNPVEGRDTHTAYGWPE